MKVIIRNTALIAYGFALARASDSHSADIYVSVLLVGGMIAGIIAGTCDSRKTA